MKFILISVLSFMIGNVFAGTEDWTGIYNIRAVNGQEFTVSHTPNYVQFMFFRVGSCLTLGKDSSINGLRMPTDVSLCTKYNVEEFTTEVEKFSTILNKKIVLGPSYTTK